ncbi:hypothetical protein SLEP1_g23305 [Rubroshorea leprosula]|uniref:Uncharacterized protein n=1 Tax=Rubroshorea leprosula TaxID=152421 RepID=A0AAV5JC00_9ROSI|nr:hypothetical protein SLEP1_g23305 [Rubroshorea leprosula]
MEASVACKLQCSVWIDPGKFARNPSGSVRFNASLRRNEKIPVLISAQMQPQGIPNRHRSVSLKASCSFENFPGTFPFRLTLTIPIEKLLQFFLLIL